MRKRRSGESGLAMGLASITSPQSESRFASQANHFRPRWVGKCSKVTKRYHAPLTSYQRALAHAKVTAAVKRRLRGSVSLAPSGRTHGRVSHKPRGTWQLRRSSCRTGARPATRLHELRAGNRSDVRQDLRKKVTAGETRATHRGRRRPYKTRVRMAVQARPAHYYD